MLKLHINAFESVRLGHFGLGYTGNSNEIIGEQEFSPLTNSLTVPQS